MADELSQYLPFPSDEGATPGGAIPKALRHVEITEQVYYGKPCYVLKDPTTLRFYRLRPPEYMIYQMLDGQKTAEDVVQALDERFPGEQYDQQAVMSFIIMLRGANLLQVPGDSSTEYLLKRKKVLTRNWFKRIRQEYLFFRIPLLDPDRLLNFLYRYLGGVFYSRWMMWVVLLMMSGGVWLLLENIDKFGQSQPLLSWLNIIYMAGAVLLIKPIHEFGHGLTAKHFGCEVHEMGFLLLVFNPCFYCDVSDAWMIPEKRKRMWITGAGVAVEIVIASLATYVWALTEPKTFVNQMSLNIMLVASVNSLLFNGNPLLRYDGYYFVMDLLEIPNLKQKGNSYLWYLLQRYVLGVDSAQMPIDVAGRETMVTLYAICSAIYRWFIMFAIVLMVWKILDPYGFGVVGGFMAVGCIYSSFVIPIGRFLKFLFTRYHSIHLRPLSAAALVVVIGCAVYFVFLIPVEQSVDAQCVLRPSDVHPIYVTQPGIILASENPTYIRDGQKVHAGEVLLVLSDPDLSGKVSDLEMNISQLKVQQDLARQQGSMADVARFQAEIDGLKAQYDQAKQNLDKLTLRSPIDGIVQLRTKKPLRNLEGSFMPLQTELFSVYKPDEFDAVTAVNHRDYGHVEVGQSVEIKLWALSDEVFNSKIRVKPPKPVWRMSSAAFSTIYGGDVPTMPATKAEEAVEPAENTYELELPLPDDPRLRDGLTGRAKIIITKKTLGRALYVWFVRTLRQDIRL